MKEEFNTKFQIFLQHIYPVSNHDKTITQINDLARQATHHIEALNNASETLNTIIKIDPTNEQAFKSQVETMMHEMYLAKAAISTVDRIINHYNDTVLSQIASNAKKPKLIKALVNPQSIDVKNLSTLHDAKQRLQAAQAKYEQRYAQWIQYKLRNTNMPINKETYKNILSFIVGPFKKTYNEIKQKLAEIDIKIQKREGIAHINAELAEIGVTITQLQDQLSLLTRPFSYGIASKLLGEKLIAIEMIEQIITETISEKSPEEVYSLSEPTLTNIFKIKYILNQHLEAQRHLYEKLLQTYQSLQKQSQASMKLAATLLQETSNEALNFPVLPELQQQHDQPLVQVENDYNTAKNYYEAIWLGEEGIQGITERLRQLHDAYNELLRKAVAEEALIVPLIQAIDQEMQSLATLKQKVDSDEYQNNIKIIKNRIPLEQQKVIDDNATLLAQDYNELVQYWENINTTWEESRYNLSQWNTQQLNETVYQKNLQLLFQYIQTLQSKTQPTIAQVNKLLENFNDINNQNDESLMQKNIYMDQMSAPRNLLQLSDEVSQRCLNIFGDLRSTNKVLLEMREKIPPDVLNAFESNEEYRKQKLTDEQTKSLIDNLRSDTGAGTEKAEALAKASDPLKAFNLHNPTVVNLARVFFVLETIYQNFTEQHQQLSKKITDYKAILHASREREQHGLQATTEVVVPIETAKRWLSDFWYKINKISYQLQAELSYYNILEPQTSIIKINAILVKISQLWNEFKKILPVFDSPEYQNHLNQLQFSSDRHDQSLYTNYQSQYANFLQDMEYYTTQYNTIRNNSITLPSDEFSKEDINAIVPLCAQLRLTVEDLTNAIQRLDETGDYCEYESADVWLLMQLFLHKYAPKSPKWIIYPDETTEGILHPQLTAKQLEDLAHQNHSNDKFPLHPNNSQTTVSLINISNSHWTLLIKIIAEQPRIVWVDSNAIPVHERPDIDAALKVLYPTTIPVTLKERYQDEEDKSDCGPILLVLLKDLWRHAFFPRPNKIENIWQIRAHFTKLLINIYTAAQKRLQLGLSNTPLPPAPDIPEVEQQPSLAPLSTQISLENTTILQHELIFEKWKLEYENFLRAHPDEYKNTIYSSMATHRQTASSAISITSLGLAALSFFIVLSQAKKNAEPIFVKEWLEWFFERKDIIFTENEDMIASLWEALFFATFSYIMFRIAATIPTNLIITQQQNKKIIQHKALYKLLQRYWQRYYIAHQTYNKNNLNYAKTIVNTIIQLNAQDLSSIGPQLASQIIIGFMGIQAFLKVQWDDKKKRIIYEKHNGENVKNAMLAPQYETAFILSHSIVETALNLNNQAAIVKYLMGLLQQPPSRYAEALSNDATWQAKQTAAIKDEIDTKALLCAILYPLYTATQQHTNLKDLFETIEHEQRITITVSLLQPMLQGNEQEEYQIHFNALNAQWELLYPNTTIQECALTCGVHFLKLLNAQQQAALQQLHAALQKYCNQNSLPFAHQFKAILLALLKESYPDAVSWPALCIMQLAKSGTIPLNVEGISIFTDNIERIRIFADDYVFHLPKNELELELEQIKYAVYLRASNMLQKEEQLITFSMNPWKMIKIIPFYLDNFNLIRATNTLNSAFPVFAQLKKISELISKTNKVASDQIDSELKNLLIEIAKQDAPKLKACLKILLNEPQTSIELIGIQRIISILITNAEDPMIAELITTIIIVAYEKKEAWSDKLFLWAIQNLSDNAFKSFNEKFNVATRRCYFLGFPISLEEELKNSLMQNFNHLNMAVNSLNGLQRFYEIATPDATQRQIYLAKTCFETLKQHIPLEAPANTINATDERLQPINNLISALAKRDNSQQAITAIILAMAHYWKDKNVNNFDWKLWHTQCITPQSSNSNTHFRPASPLQVFNQAAKEAEAVAQQDPEKYGTVQFHLEKDTQVLIPIHN